VGFTSETESSLSVDVYRFGFWSEAGLTLLLEDQTNYPGPDLIGLLNGRTGSSSDSSDLLDNLLSDGLMRDRLGWLLTKTFLNCLCNLIDLSFVADFEVDLP
jgi:hypothetical protein